MQPYFIPYIGYFQLINAVDEFVIYDNIEFTKKGWINRNRILVNGKDDYLTIPLKKDSDFLQIKKRFLAESWIKEKKKVLNKIAASYRKSDHFEIVYPVIEKSILFEDNNLFNFIYNSIIKINEYLEIDTSVIVASNILIDHDLKSERKVIEICKARKADTYINSVGGKELYSKENFKKENIDLKFIKSKDISYKQFNSEFVPWLSIVDVMMFNSKSVIKQMLSFTELI